MNRGWSVMCVKIRDLYFYFESEVPLLHARAYTHSLSLSRSLRPLLSHLSIYLFIDKHDTSFYFTLFFRLPQTPR